MATDGPFVMISGQRLGRLLYRLKGHTDGPVSNIDLDSLHCALQELLRRRNAMRSGLNEEQWTALYPEVRRVN